MKKIIFPVLGLVLVTFSLNFVIYNSTSESYTETITSQKVDDFTLSDYYGKTYSLSDFKDSKAIVLMFISVQCPVSNAYNEKMNKLYEKYNSKNITFIGINSNKTESIDDIKNHANDHNFKFIILKDWKNIIADRLNAQVTPEIFVLNNNSEIQYHGRIDDARSSGPAKNNDLNNALNEMLKDENVAVTKTRAVGCTIKRI